VVVGVGQKATITVPNVVGATGYRVYRGILADGSDAKWVGRIADPPANADGVFVDKGQWNTVDSTGKKNNGLAIVIEPDPGDVCIAQLAPLLKMPLPQVDTTFPFLLLLYIVFVLKASERVKIYKNCGQYISP